MIVVDVQIAVLAPLDAELLPVERPRSLKEKLVLLIHELKVREVSLLFLPAVLGFSSSFGLRLGDFPCGLLFDFF